MTKEYICYCFKHTREALEEDARKYGLRHYRADHC